MKQWMPLILFALLGARLSAKFSAKPIIQLGVLLVILGLIQLILCSGLVKRKLVET